jgi:hypothetical protein
MKQQSQVNSGDIHPKAVRQGGKEKWKRRAFTILERHKEKGKKQMN